MSAELRVGLSGIAGQELREAVELLEFGRLFFRQIRVVLMALVITAEAERVVILIQVTLSAKL